MSRARSDLWPARSEVPATLAQFYREEFLKHQRCLERQREYYSERAISDVQAALTRTLAELEHLCCKHDADRIVSELLRQFDVVTGLSAWPDPKEVH
jgi:hypothetical protein